MILDSWPWVPSGDPRPWTEAFAMARGEIAPSTTNLAPWQIRGTFVSTWARKSFLFYRVISCYIKDISIWSCGLLCYSQIWDDQPISRPSCIFSSCPVGWKHERDSDSSVAFENAIAGYPWRCQLCEQNDRACAGSSVKRGHWNGSRHLPAVFLLWKQHWGVRSL